MATDVQLLSACSMRHVLTTVLLILSASHCLRASWQSSLLATKYSLWSPKKLPPVSPPVSPLAASSLLSSIYSKNRPTSALQHKLTPSTVNPDPSSQTAAAYYDPVCSPPQPLCAKGKYRTADGTCNNVYDPTLGSTGLPQVRMLPPQYEDGIDQPRIASVRQRPLPSARDVSQRLHTADNTGTESPNLTQLFTVWGQFLDHDVTHTPISRDADGSKLDCCLKPIMYPKRDFYWMPSSQPEQLPVHNPNCFPITVDPHNDRFFTTICMNFVRSKAFAPSPTCESATREQGNTQTAYIDASMVYGASLGDQYHLRTLQKGQLKSAQFHLLPGNSTTMCTKRPNSGDFCFGSGDPRVNEHPMLSSLHTVFHRLHNVLATRLALLNPHWDDEILYQEARKIVGAIIQHVTYAEYLPLVLGDQEMERFNLTLGAATDHVYRPDVDPRIINAFSTAAFRFGHSMVNGNNSYGFQKLNLRDMFFHPYYVQHEKGAGLTMVLNGLIRDHSQSSDRFMNKDLTDHLFQTKDGRSLDLASLNIQRGRDHGLPSYNSFRKACGLPSLQEVLQVPGKFSGVPFLSVYSDLDDVDLFTGGLTEEAVLGGVVGPTFSCIIGKQFHNLKFGDRFWFQNTQHEGALTLEQMKTIQRIGLSDVLCDTSELSAVPSNPFVLASLANPVLDCSAFLPIDLSAWQELPLTF